MQDICYVVVVQLSDDFGQSLWFAINQRGIAQIIGQLIDNQCLLLWFEQSKQNGAVVWWR